MNAVAKESVYPREYAEGFVNLFNPLCPHVTEEIWEKLGHKNTIAYEKWPTYEEEKIVEDEITIGVQVNGKLRGTISIPKDATKEETEEIAKKNENVLKFIDGKEIVKTIVIPGKIVNIVVK